MFCRKTAKHTPLTAVPAAAAHAHGLVAADKIKHERRRKDEAVAPEHDSCDPSLPDSSIQAVCTMVRRDQLHTAAHPPRCQPSAPCRSPRPRVDDRNPMAHNNLSEAESGPDENIDRILTAERRDVHVQDAMVRQLHNKRAASRRHERTYSALRREMLRHLERAALNAAQVHRWEHLQDNKRGSSGRRSRPARPARPRRSIRGPDLPGGLQSLPYFVWVFLLPDGAAPVRAVRSRALPGRRHIFHLFHPRSPVTGAWVKEIG